jgi:hypothetical protein
MAVIDSVGHEIGTVSAEAWGVIATRQLQVFLTHGEAGTLELWNAALLPEAGELPWNDQPIYDIHGNLCFRDKTLALKDGTEIRARAAASTLLGAPIWALFRSQLFNLSDAMKEASKKAAELGLVPVAGEQALVCYSFPKLGLLAKTADGELVVIDLADLSQIQVAAAAKVTSPEDITCWSPYDFVSAATIGLLRESWTAQSATLSSMQTLRADLPSPTAVAASVKLLDVPSYSQETPVYCAVAVAQMILRYFGFNKTQTEIAAVMHTGATGTENPDQVAGYPILSGGTLTATYDETARYENAKANIDRGSPMKSGIPGHARAAIGYREENDRRFLFMNDPWPPGKGLTYWENWAGPQPVHTNFIYVEKTKTS